MSITQYQVHQFIKRCALGALALSIGHLNATMHGYRGDFDAWCKRVEAYRQDNLLMECEV